MTRFYLVLAVAVAAVLALAWVVFAPEVSWWLGERRRRRRAATRKGWLA